jgi:nucleotide-binding universal stress UspA family protein
MFQQILVPLDGSARAEQALPVAARIARAAQGTITVVEAVSPPPPLMVATGVIVLPELLDENVPAAKEYLEGIAQTSSLGGIPTVTRVAGILPRPSSQRRGKVRSISSCCAVMATRMPCAGRWAVSPKKWHGMCQRPS